MAKVDCKRSRWTAPITLVCAAALLAGCSSVPDAMNPAEWYKSTVDVLSGEDSTTADAKPAGGLAADPDAPAPAESFPELATVPDRPSGLNADGGRTYATGPISRQGDAAQVLADEAPAPPPAPVVSVTPVPMTPMPQLVETAPARPSAPQNVADTMSITAPASPSITDGAPAPFEARTTLPSADALMIGGEPFETVVISGSGLEDVSSTTNQRFNMINSAADPAYPGMEVMTSSTDQTVTVDGALRVATIVFTNGSANISHADRQILAEVGQLLKERGGSLHVVGHASARTRNMEPVQHKLVNFEVSADRADKVANELKALGVPTEMITIAAASDSQPLYYEIMPSGEAGNRRAEIYLVQ